MRTLAAFILSLSFLVSSPAVAQEATASGEVETPHPTLHHISIDWPFSGDDDGDSRVSVRFRAEGDGAWRQGHPLIRVPAGSNEGFSWEKRHSGSLFGLVPGTTYEIELTLEDPDGGGQVRTLTATTRPVPEIGDDANVISVTPETIDDAMADASPGDVFDLQPGTYGPISFYKSGEEGAPIVFRGTNPAEVIIDGEFRFSGQSHVWLLDLGIRNMVKFNDSSGIVIRGCHVDTPGDGLIAKGEGTRNGYFADNVVTGSTVWSEAALGVDGDNVGEGIGVTGPGNVIAHNRLSNLRDCVSLFEGELAVDQWSIDIVGNDLHQCADDAIEADFAMGNVRVLRNRSTNSFIAWSSQPSLGGPTWWIRNVAFANAFQVFKPNRGSRGDILYHNTVVKQGDAFGVYTSAPWGRLTTRNNIFIGGPEVTVLNEWNTGEGRILYLSSFDAASSSLDYDGFGSELGRFDGQVGEITFEDFAGLRAETTETNAVQLDISAFEATLDFPRSMFPALSPVDLQLADDSPAVDAGTVLSNVNDGFNGAAPDLGAYELGSPPPPYGPRTGDPVCGNGIVETGEECDDGGTAQGDGCSADCTVEQPGEQDAGNSSPDSGHDGDDGADAGADPDADVGPATDDGGSKDNGCGCRLVGRTSGSGVGLVFGLLGLFLWRRRNRGHHPREQAHH